MLPYSFRDLEWHKGKKHRHRRLSLLLRGLPVANQSHELQHTFAGAFLKHGGPCVLLAPGGSEVASAPLQFLPHHAKE